MLKSDEDGEGQEETGDAGDVGAFMLTFGDDVRDVGAFILSFGFAGKDGQRVRECDCEGLELTSDMDPKLDVLVCVPVAVDGALLNTDLAGELVTEAEAELAGDGSGGDCCDCGIWASLRTAMRVRCSRFRANRLEIYSRAVLRW